MLSFKMVCNPSIAETRTRTYHTEPRVMDMFSFKVAYNPPWKLVAEMTGSVGLWG